MATLEDTASDLAHWEGFRPFVYDDATGLPITSGTLVQGHPTIGYGFCLDTHGLNIKEADVILSQRIANLQNWAAYELAAIWNKLARARQRVVLGMVYQVGITGYRKFIAFNIALANGNYDGAARELLNSEVAKQCPRRWAWYAKMMRAGEDCPYE